MSVGVVDKTTGDRIPTAGDPLDKVGNLANLTTTAKGDAVEAINEVNATKANQTQMATVEASATASKAYSANEYLVLGGVLYKVTANIAQGGTIVTEGSGKNVDLATVGGELSAINSNLTSLSAEYVIKEYEVYDHTGTIPELANGTRYNYVHDINKVGYTPICANCRYDSNQGSADIDVYFGKENGSWRIRVIVYNTWDGGTIAPPDYVSVLYKKNAT